MKRVLIIVIVLVLAGSVAAFALRDKIGKKKTTFTEVTVERGDLTEKALATGKIDPDHEIVVKSQVSGIVEKIHREVGATVRQGDPLMIVKPDPTPLELAEARRQYELADLNRQYMATDLARSKALFEGSYISGKEYENAQKALQEAEVRTNQMKERLELMESGTSRIGDRLVETVIRAPTDGTVLERMVNVGDPVVPLTSYQPGTELMRMSSMDDLIFIGTVDEIDVGKVAVGMSVNIKIGALPGEVLPGEVYFISPKSRIRDNVVVFDIKIRILDTKGITLRAGYSANADIIIKEKKQVLILPERLIEFKGDTTLVYQRDAKADTLVSKKITLGFSDGLSAEIVDGLAEGDKVVEK